MPKDEWGVKRVCPTCSARFYDLRQDPMTCPSCGAAFTVESLSLTKPKAPRAEKAKEPLPAAETEDLPDIDTDADVIDTDDDIADDILEDDDDDNVDLDDIKDVASDEDDDS